MNSMNQVANKREVVNPLHKESSNVFSWVTASLEVITAGTIIVSVLYAIFPFKFK